MLHQNTFSVAPTYTKKYAINYLLAKENILKADTGSSRTYLQPSHRPFLRNVQDLANGPKATLPDGSSIQADCQGTLNLIPNVPLPALTFPELRSESLLPIGQLCDAGCIAIFDKHYLQIFKDERLVLSGQRNKADGLWDVPFNNSSNTKMNYIISKNKSKTELAQYLHGCAFSPTLKTLQDAVDKGNFISWPDIDDLNFQTLLSAPLATILGHLDQERKNLQSTKLTQSPTSPQLSTPDPNDELSPAKIDSKTYDCCYKIIELPDKATTYTDQTGRFPHQSSSGNNYVMVCYNYDANCILVTPLPNREAPTLAKTWSSFHNRLTPTGHVTNNYILDNEFSGALKEAITNANLSFELVPPHQHRRNAAERAIRTFKNHFVAGLATCDTDFPLREWDRLLPQAELTLNLLRNSRVNPKLSAWAYLFGNHNFNKVPLLPSGTRIVMHVKPDNQRSWAFHGEKGWYIGPDPNHYRCLKVYIPKTHRERITDTAKIIPKQIPIPEATLDDHLRYTADDLVHLLHKNLQFSHPQIYLHHGEPCWILLSYYIVILVQLFNH